MLHLSWLCIVYWKWIALKLLGVTYCFSCHSCCLSDVFIKTQSTVKPTCICFRKQINQYAKIANGVAFCSSGTQRSQAEADPVVLAAWDVRLQIHCPSLTNRGLQCTTELFTPLHYDYLQYAVHEDRTKGAEQIYMGWSPSWIYSRSERVTSQVIRDEEKQRHIRVWCENTFNLMVLTRSGHASNGRKNVQAATLVFPDI